MSDQEMIDAIDAEIAATEANKEKLRPGRLEYLELLRGYIAYINGLRFARALIVKRMEGGK